jgi:hypothetical protein
VNKLVDEQASINEQKLKFDIILDTDIDGLKRDRLLKIQAIFCNIKGGIKSSFYHYHWIFINQDE